MAPALTQLTVPLIYYSSLFPGNDLEAEINWMCMWMGLIAVGTFLSMFV